MITKEQKINKYCCLYVKFLFPYEMIDQNSKILIYTQKNLIGSIKILLDKTNLNFEDKSKILNIKYWNNENMGKICNENDTEYTIIVNGDKEFLTNINKKIENLKAEVVNIVDCYDINNIDIKSQYINDNYKGVLNTQSI